MAASVAEGSAEGESSVVIIIFQVIFLVKHNFLLSV